MRTNNSRRHGYNKLNVGGMQSLYRNRNQRPGCTLLSDHGLAVPLEGVAALAGFPQSITVDHGSEFISKAIEA